METTVSINQDRIGHCIQDSLWDVWHVWSVRDMRRSVVSFRGHWSSSRGTARTRGGRGTSSIIRAWPGRRWF